MNILLIIKAFAVSYLDLFLFVFSILHDLGRKLGNVLVLIYLTNVFAGGMAQTLKRLVRSEEIESSLLI